MTNLFDKTSKNNLICSVVQGGRFNLPGFGGGASSSASSWTNHVTFLWLSDGQVLVPPLYLDSFVSQLLGLDLFTQRPVVRRERVDLQYSSGDGIGLVAPNCSTAVALMKAKTPSPYAVSCSRGCSASLAVVPASFVGLIATTGMEGLSRLWLPICGLLS